MSAPRRRPDFDTRFVRDDKSKRPARTLRRRLLIVCGASRTEPLYLEGLNSHLRNPAVRIKVLAKSCAPLQVVEYAIHHATVVGDSYDELWCVVDVDQFTGLGEAIRRAATCTAPPTTVIVSNPCFELWLLLHFADHRAHVASYAQLKPLLRKHLPNYDKSRLDFARGGYAETYGAAVERAMALEPTGTDFSRNPSTNMWQLIEAMKR